MTKNFLQNRFVFAALTLLAFFALAGCNDDSGGSDYSVSGQLKWTAPQDAEVALLNQDGETLGSAKVDDDGNFKIGFDQDIADESYCILQVNQDGRILRAAVTGYDGQKEYSGPDTVVSPMTEAAVLACSATGTFRPGDYGPFLRSFVDETYDPACADSFAFPYHAIIEDLGDEVENYFSGAIPDRPNMNQVYELMAQSSCFLPVLASTLDIPVVTQAIISPTNSTVLFLSYDPRNSTIDGQDYVTFTTEEGQDGLFKWISHTLDLGDNVLVNASVELAEPEDQVLGLDTTVISYSNTDGAGYVASLGVMLPEEMTGEVEVTASNAGNFVDVNNCGFQVMSDGVSAEFQLEFNQDVEAYASKVEFTLMSFSGKERTVWQTMDLNQGRTYKSAIMTLTEADKQDKRLVALIKHGRKVLYAVADAVDKTRYQATRPIISAVSMSETRANSTDMYNNLYKSNDVNMQPVDAGNVYSHYIIDLDRLLNAPQVVPSWAATNYGHSPQGDKDRIPLVLVHGWEGDHDLRSSVNLSQWGQSPVDYWFDLVSYYMSKPELYNKYHVYMVHWPSYKHLTMNGKMLANMLETVKTTHPESDLAQGLSDEKKGVVVITHSTGGLIFRTALESHGAFSTADTPGAYLRRAIILASPNHGTPEATNLATHSLPRDVSTQSSSDLEWDSYDGRSNIAMIPWLLGYSYKADRSGSRWLRKYQNVEQFDIHFLAELSGDQLHTYNPWLLWFNNRFFAKGNNDPLRSKYYCYAALTRTTRDDYDFTNNSVFNWTSEYLYDVCGYYSDGVLPMGSTMFTSGLEDGFYMPYTLANHFHMHDWYPKSELYDFRTTILVKGNREDHPDNMPFRFFWDYDHDQLLQGVCSTLSRDRIAELIDQGDVVSSSYDTAFRDELYRHEYIQGALKLTKDEDRIITDYLNPLKYEPVFMFIEMDLLNL